jgi:hypothetical protein
MLGEGVRAASLDDRSLAEGDGRRVVGAVESRVGAPAGVVGDGVTGATVGCVDKEGAACDKASRSSRMQENRCSGFLAIAFKMTALMAGETRGLI